MAGIRICRWKRIRTFIMCYILSSTCHTCGSSAAPQNSLADTPVSQRRKAKLRELVSYPEIHDGRSETQPRAVRLPGPHFRPLCDATSVPNKQVPGRGPWSKDAVSGKDNACAEKVWRAC